MLLVLALLCFWRCFAAALLLTAQHLLEPASRTRSGYQNKLFPCNTPKSAKTTNSIQLTIGKASRHTPSNFKVGGKPTFSTLPIRRHQSCGVMKNVRSFFVCYLLFFFLFRQMCGHTERHRRGYGTPEQVHYVFVSGGVIGTGIGIDIRIVFVDMLVSVSLLSIYRYRCRLRRCIGFSYRYRYRLCRCIGILYRYRYRYWCRFCPYIGIFVSLVSIYRYLYRNMYHIAVVIDIVLFNINSRNCGVSILVFCHCNTVAVAVVTVVCAVHVLAA